MSGFERPNYTQAPNAFFDKLLPLIDTMTELKVTLAIMRKTMGWGKEEDTLSLSQLQKLTGLRREGVVDGVAAGLERGTIVRRKSGNSFAYALKVVGKPDQQGSRQTGPSASRQTGPTKETLKESSSSNEEAAGKPPRAGQSDEWVGDSAPISEKQSYFVGYLARRLGERGLSEKKPLTGSYRKQFVGEVAAHVNKGYGRGRILAGIDYIVFRWRVERVGLSVGIDRAEGQDNVRQLRPVEENPSRPGGGLPSLRDRLG